MVAGTFDIIHKGHLNFFAQAKKQGNWLIAIIARDDTILKEKKKSLVHTEQERIQHVQELKIVDEAHLGNKSDKLKIIQTIQPDVIALGYDQSINVKALQAHLQKHNLTAKIVIMQPFHPEVYKSSKLRHISTKTQEATSSFDAKKFFIHPKKTLFLFLISYIFLLIVIGWITESIFIRSCLQCPVNIITTIIFHTGTLGIVYFLFSWAVHIWKKIIKILLQ